MTTGLNTFDNGVYGTTPTVSNLTLSGSAPASITITSPDKVVYSNAVTSHGVMGIEFDFSASNTGGSRIFWNVIEPNRLAFSFYYQIGSEVTAFEDVAGIRNSTSNMVKMLIANDGKAVLYDNTDTIITASKATTVFPVDKLIRVDIAVKKGTTTSDGYLGFAYYLGNSTTPLHFWESSSQNTGTTSTAQIWIGREFGRIQQRFANYDTLRWEGPIVSGFISPYVSNISPKVDLGLDVDDISPWETINLNANAIDIDGNVVSYTWSQTSGPTTLTLIGAGPYRKYEAPGLLNGGTFIFNVIATDSNGLTATDSVTHTVLPSTEFAVGITGILIPLKITGVSRTGFGSASFGTSSFGG